MFSPAQAYWSQRQLLANLRERIITLSGIVDQKSDLSMFQWAQLIAVAVEYKPDLILELGRGRGNSTCAFTLAADAMKPYSCKVLSLCLSENWSKTTLPKLQKAVPASFFEPLTALETDILRFDYGKALEKAKRVLVFWDAHGFDVAECVLGGILPLLADKEHMVIMHDLSDSRYVSAESRVYGGKRLWRGNDWSGPRLFLGNINTAVEQGIAIHDFTTRNALALNSADHSLHEEIGKDDGRRKELESMLGLELFSLSAHWFWFTLNERGGGFTYPAFSPLKCGHGAKRRSGGSRLGRIFRSIFLRADNQT